MKGDKEESPKSSLSQKELIFLAILVCTLEKLTWSKTLSDYNRQVLVGVFINPEWTHCGFKVGKIVEVGYHSSEEELVESADDENAEYQRYQTWGTWNPLMLDYLTEEHVKVLVTHLDWRCSKYEGLEPGILEQAKKLVIELQSSSDA